MRQVVRFSPHAKRDLADIFTYVASNAGDRIAQDYVAKLYQYCLSFETFPERGARRDDLRPRLRTVGFHRRATIAFTVGKESILILRIFHAGRNIKL